MVSAFAKPQCGQVSVTLTSATRYLTCAIAIWLQRVLTVCLKSPDSLSAPGARHRRIHDPIVAAVRLKGGDGVSNDTDDVFCDADDVFCDADTLPRHEFVNYTTVSRQPIGLTHDPRQETWIRGR